MYMSILRHSLRLPLNVLHYLLICFYSMLNNLLSTITNVEIEIFECSSHFFLIFWSSISLNSLSRSINKPAYPIFIFQYYRSSVCIKTICLYVALKNMFSFCVDITIFIIGIFDNSKSMRNSCMFLILRLPTCLMI